MKTLKYFFLIALAGIIFYSATPINSFTNESAPQTIVTIIFKDGNGNTINNVSGCFGSVTFNTTNGTASAGDLPPGNYNLCASGSGHFGNSSYSISGSRIVITHIMQPSESSCGSCGNE